jgi:hypothetical protein
MQPSRGHAAVALLSVLVAAVTIVFTAMACDPRSPGTLLAVVLIANAAVRFRLAGR